MSLDAVYRKIDRWLRKDNSSAFSSSGPQIVDVQNPADLNELVTHYNLGENKFISAAEFCAVDEFPKFDELQNLLNTEKKNFFVRGVSTFLMLKGEDELSQMLKEMLCWSTAGHVVFITCRCERFLEKIARRDPRLAMRITVVKGEAKGWPDVTFTAPGLYLGTGVKPLKGLSHLAAAVESGANEKIYVQSAKSRANFPYSLLSLHELKSGYAVLCMADEMTKQLDESLGTEEQWQWVNEQFKKEPSWEKLVRKFFGTTAALDNAISDFSQFDAMKKWLYFIALKLFGAGTNEYLREVAANADAEGLVRGIYRELLRYRHDDPKFWYLYWLRKKLLQQIGDFSSEVKDFCSYVGKVGADALFYLTDNTQDEKDCLVLLLGQYGAQFDRDALKEILSHVCPAFAMYLTPFSFKNELLNKYFREYTYLKLINKVTPEFLAMVDEQAEKRDFYEILPARTAITEEIEHDNAQTYFTDAMGVEFLGYIMEKCRELKLMAKVTVCRCELPSITVRNKEFYEVLETTKFPILKEPRIDEIKHHGELIDFRKAALPLHLSTELGIIDKLLEAIESNLIKDVYGKAILVSDHGASRLAVLHKTENIYEMGTKGQHSGRCCPKEEFEKQPEGVPGLVDADDYWALANYDRFKGSRPADVEVHGGATLEEVTVPIIEITYQAELIEISLHPEKSTTPEGKTAEIKVGLHDTATIRIYATRKLEDVSVDVEGNRYQSQPLGGNFYLVKMPGIKTPKVYTVNVYSSDKLLASQKLRVSSAAFDEDEDF